MNYFLRESAPGETEYIVHTLEFGVVASSTHE